MIYNYKTEQKNVTLFYNTSALKDGVNWAEKNWHLSS